MRPARIHRIAWLVAFGATFRGASAQEPLAANQSAAVEPPSNRSPNPAEPNVGEPIRGRSRPTNRTIVVDPPASHSQETVPWYRTGLGATTVVLALLGVLFWALRRWAPSVKTASGTAMNVVARSAVTPRHSVATVQWGRRFILVGVSPDRMDALAEVADPGEAAELAGMLGVRWPAGGMKFDERLLSESAAYDEPVSRPRTSEVKASAVGELLQRLRTMKAP